jgi:GT2 family glycosyltransferase
VGAQKTLAKVDLTIIIVNWNGGDLLLRCLRSILESRTSFNVKVIVVDNDSADGSRERAAKDFPEFTVFNSGGNLGFGRANNLARSMADTPLVLFLNPDTELKPDTLERMVDLMKKRPEVGAAGCLMRYPDGTVQEQGLQWYPTPVTVFLELLLANRMCRSLFRRWLPRIDPLKSTYLRKLYGGFVMARKEVLDQAGWFDDRYFMYAEDVDLSRTLTALGWRLYYFSEAEAIHVCGGSSAKAPSGFAVLMKNESVAKYMNKYYGGLGEAIYRLAILSAAGISFLLRLPSCIVSAAFGGDRNGWSKLVSKDMLLLLWALGARKAKVVQRPSVQVSPTPTIS